MGKKKKAKPGKPKSKGSLKGLARSPFTLTEKDLSKIKGGKKRKGGGRFIVPQ